ncbi:hypothetical protein [uncultured Croceitalea sp.]|uniref:hypothetical protein n=1 Tax=uncultured Croceitalea sp. TaxID=1798908 RepID=UPI0033063B95
MGVLKNYGMIIKSENIFLEEDYGKPISEKLSVILRRYISKDDLANVAIRSKVSFSTIRDVIYRTNSLTKVNSKAISLLIYTAFENSIAKKLQAEGDIIFMDNILKL